MLAPVNSPEYQRWIRIKVSLWAYAYEMKAVPMVSDADFDRGCLLIDPSVTTRNAKLDAFFRDRFSPDTGMWIHEHPGLRRLGLLYDRLQETRKPSVAVSFELRYGRSGPPSAA